MTADGDREVGYFVQDVEGIGVRTSESLDTPEGVGNAIIHIGVVFIPTLACTSRTCVAMLLCIRNRLEGPPCRRTRALRATVRTPGTPAGTPAEQ